MPISRLEMMEGKYHPGGYTRFEPYYIFMNEDHTEMILEAHYVGARAGQKYRLTVDRDKKILQITSNRIHEAIVQISHHAFGGFMDYDAMPVVANTSTKRIMNDRLLMVPELANSNRHKYHDVLSMQESFEITGPFIRMFREKLKKFVEYNGLTYPDLGSLDVEIRSLTSPLSRLLNTVYYPDYSGNEGVSSSPIELMDSFEQIVQYIFGQSTPKLIKLTAAKLFLHQESDVGIAPEVDQIFNEKERQEAVQMGYRGKAPYVPLRVNIVQLNSGWIALTQILVEAP